ncbi:hypothetical protein PI125_g21286 [Phytophthora idaei]|nr:hypothetical protein PI125_g21286 [Phytophthora idaei]
MDGYDRWEDAADSRRRERHDCPLDQLESENQELRRRLRRQQESRRGRWGSGAGDRVAGDSSAEAYRRRR